MNKLKEIKTRIFSTEALSLMKEDQSYKELSEALDLSPPVLSRYVNGHVLPRLKRAQKIIDAFKEKEFPGIVDGKVTKGEDGTLNISPLVQNTKLLEIIGKMVFNEYKGVDKVLTAETDGIPLAVQVASQYNVRTIIAKEKKEPGISEFLEERCSISPTIKYLNIPKSSINQGEKVLIVDDLVRSGSTLNALIRFVEKSKAEVSGVFTAVSVDGGIERIKERSEKDYKIKSLLNF